MIMPNDLRAYRRTMNGAELTETVRAFVEGCEGGFTPFNRGSLPVVSGIAIEVKEENGGFTLTGITRDGKPLPRGRDRNRNLSGDGGQHGAAVCGREPCLRGRRHESSGHLARMSHGNAYWRSRKTILH